MSLVNRTIITKPIEAARNSPAFVLAATMVVAATMVSGALIFQPLFTPPAAPAPAVTSGDLVDGWEPGALAAAAARLERVQDGYLPGLLAAAAARLERVQDGYLRGLLAANPPQDIVDGAMPTFVAGAAAADVRDSWEPYLLP